MKIVFLADDFPPMSFGGAGISTSDLALGMKKEGHEVFVITTCREKSEAGKTEYNGLTIFRIASNYGGRWRAYVSLNNIPVVRQVTALLKVIRPDVVHINNVHSNLSYRCFKVAKKYAHAVVFTARDTMSVCYGKLDTKQYLERFDYHTTWRDHVRQAKKGWNPFRNRIIKRYLAYADKKFAVSNALRKALIENGIKNVEVMHTGADVDAWGATEHEILEFRRKHNAEGTKIILFGGRLSEGKGGHKALEMMSEIAKAVPDAVLLVAGSVDSYASKMREKARSLGIGDRLAFTGWIGGDEVRVAYAAAHVVLVPSLYLDPFPRIVIEAMASGRPVVGTCYGGSPEIIVDGVTGYVVNPLHQEEVISKTLDLLRNHEKAEQFGRAGLERIKKDFNVANKVKEYIIAYESIIERKL